MGTYNLTGYLNSVAPKEGGGGHLVLFRIQSYLDYGDHTLTKTYHVSSAELEKMHRQNVLIRVMYYDYDKRFASDIWLVTMPLIRTSSRGLGVGRQRMRGAACIVEGGGGETWRSGVGG